MAHGAGGRGCIKLQPRISYWKQLWTSGKILVNAHLLLQLQCNLRSSECAGPRFTYLCSTYNFAQIR